MKRYTIAVCVVCGVQSPPIITDEATTSVDDALKRMGWKTDKKTHVSMAVCPECRNDKKEAV